ncbi:MAG: hypothetical protein ACTSRH_18785, partial [Promethearchaeota archaeon]
DHFVNKTLQLKRFKTTSVMNTLKEQLEVARKNLEITEKELENYREAHPLLNVSSDLSEEIRKISELDFELKSLKETERELKNLLNEQRNEKKLERSLYLKEILSFLQSKGVARAQVLLDDYNNLLIKREELISSNYKNSHPLVIDINSRIADIEKRINETLNDFQNELKQRIKSVNNNLLKLDNKLKSLPSQETKLAKLVRDKDVAERIFSNILVKFNEAKISDAAI